METIFYKKKIDLALKNELIAISSDICMNEIELEIQAGISLLNKTINLKFYGINGEEFIWPFHFSELNIKRISDYKGPPWLINNLVIDSNGCENHSIYLSIYKNASIFFD